MAQKHNEELVTELENVHVNNETGKIGVLDGCFYTFLCQKCDDVHIVFACDGMPFQFNITMPPKEAEAFANLLMNPKVET